MIFSTYQRAPVLSEEIGPKLYGYLAGVIREDGSQPLCIGGHRDHVHLRFALSRNRSLSETIRVVKASSSKWVKGQSGGLSEFAWQSGYAAFSVGQSEIGATFQYIECQEEHHRKRSFQEELQMLCEANGLEYDPRYFWE